MLLLFIDVADDAAHVRCYVYGVDGDGQRCCRLAP